MSKAKSKPVVELGAFVEHPEDDKVLGRVMATWKFGDSTEMVRVTWPKLRVESDHKASELKAVPRPEPKEEPKTEAKSKAEAKAKPDDEAEGDKP